MRRFFVKHSKEVQEGDTFFSVAGLCTNGNLYIVEAVTRGAQKIVVQEDNAVPGDVIQFLKDKSVVLEYVKDVYYEFGKAISHYYRHLVSRFTFIGVTGTKGKTTTTHAVFNFLRIFKCSAAMMSSACHKINNSTIQASLTTEMINDIYAFLEKAYVKQVTHIVLEVSAHAFTQYRIMGIQFDAFIFTNFSQEHGETYRTQEDYFLAKCELYKYMKSNAIVLLNKDDEKVMISALYGSENNVQVRTYSSKIDSDSDISYGIIDSDITNTRSFIHYRGQRYEFYSPWIGLYNISNIVTAFFVVGTLCKIVDEAIPSVLSCVKNFSSVPGRNEKYFLYDDKIVIIEKACTVNSVESVLNLLKEFSSHIVVVFGCGGDRDVSKRPLLAKTIEDFAELVYVSTDNPRNESQSKIFSDIAKGFSFKKNVSFLYDRKEAIEKAIHDAPKKSIIVLLGKGDDEYQLIKGKKYYFSEKEIIQKYRIK
jgi:UDP-N-acetylmuramoyl-L-alanyl-D-glutamate--2,6-diaminopimelate ligase